MTGALLSHAAEGRALSARSGDGQGPRLLLYGHDTYGLGHLRRNLAIAGYLAETIPGLSTLLLTGSPVAQHFALPAGVDYVKLPSVIKIGDEHYRARDLDLPPEGIVALRAAVIAEVAEHFAPDVVLVDHAPLGMKEELLPALRRLRRVLPHARLILGLRDVIDEAHKVRRQWAETGVYAAMETFYDEVLIYGQADIFDPVRAYAFPPALADRTRFCGYIRRPEPVGEEAALRSDLGLGDDPFILVTAGGAATVWPWKRRSWRHCSGSMPNRQRS